MTPILSRWLRALFGSGGSNEAHSRPLKPPPEITADPEAEGWHDFVFTTTSPSEHGDGELALSAFGTHHGLEVGLRIVIGSDWQAVPIGEGLPGRFFQKGTIRFESLDARSDALLTAIDAEYGTGLRPRRFRAAIPFNGIALEGHPRQLSAGRVSIKLFYEAQAPEGYAELFVNVDLPNARIEVREKDEAYRAAIVRALRQE